MLQTTVLATIAWFATGILMQTGAILPTYSSSLVNQNLQTTRVEDVAKNPGVGSMPQPQVRTQRIAQSKPMGRHMYTSPIETRQSVITSGSFVSTTTTRIVPYPREVDDAAVKKTLVNIFCLSDDDRLNSISGTGVIVSSGGLVLTTAHLGQYFLLAHEIESGLLACSIRTGSPAHDKYRAEAVFVSPDWIEENSDVIASADAKGNGENDFALLKIVKTIDDSSLPGQFPAALPEANAIQQPGDRVVAAGYPAEYIPEDYIGKSLYALSLPTMIDTIFTFESDTVDLVSIDGAYLAQRGASGGPVFNAEGKLIGIITTASETGSSTRKLNAITLDYVSRQLKSETGLTLLELLNGNFEILAANFGKAGMIRLEAILMHSISGR